MKFISANFNLYKEYISSEIPPWDDFGSTPRIVRFFMMALTS